MRINVKLYAVIVICAVIVSCNSSKKTTIAKATIDGTWVVKNIAIEGLGGKVEATAFNEANYNCFTGSVWKFNDAQKTGEFTINEGAAADCPVINRQINWKINSSDISNKK